MIFVARANRSGGIITPICFAVLRLITSSNFVGINLQTHQLDRKFGSPIALSLRISVLDGDVLSFYVAKLAQRQPNSLGTGGLSSCIDRR
jgi:hypothetical protein